MNPLKLTLLTIVSFLMLQSSLCGQAEYLINIDVATLKVTSDTKESDLVKASKEFKQKKNIDIWWEDIKRYDDGSLKSYTLYVDCNDGFSGSTYIHSFILNFTDMGFERDYTEDAKVAFSIGMM